MRSKIDNERIRERTDQGYKDRITKMEQKNAGERVRVPEPLDEVHVNLE